MTDHPSPEPVPLPTTVTGSSPTSRWGALRDRGVAMWFRVPWRRMGDGIGTASRTLVRSIANYRARWAMGASVPGVCLMSWMMYCSTTNSPQQSAPVEPVFRNLATTAVAPSAGECRAINLASEDPPLATPPDDRPCPFYGPDDVTAANQVQHASFDAPAPEAVPIDTAPQQGGAWLIGTIEDSAPASFDNSPGHTFEPPPFDRSPRSRAPSDRTSEDFRAQRPTAIAEPRTPSRPAQRTVGPEIRSQTPDRDLRGLVIQPN